MFSIVIPLYNKEVSIRNTIQSIFNQTRQNFEIVVINDGSTDSSAEIVEGLKDSRIRLINQNNQGVSAARNRGIKESKYEWILFLDGDDLWKPNHLEEISSMMDKFPNEKVYVTSMSYSDNRFSINHSHKKEIFIVENYFKEIIRKNLVSTGCIAISKECFNKVEGFNTLLSRGEDLDLWSRLAKNYSIVKSSEITVIYRLEAENRTDNNVDVEKTYVYYFTFSECMCPYEYSYNKNEVLRYLFNYFRSKDYINFSKLKRRYIEINYTDFINYFYKRLTITANRKIKNIFISDKPS